MCSSGSPDKPTCATASAYKPFSASLRTNAGEDGLPAEDVPRRGDSFFAPTIGGHVLFHGFAETLALNPYLHVSRAKDEVRSIGRPMFRGLASVRQDLGERVFVVLREREGEFRHNEKIENVSLGEPVAHRFTSFDLARRGYRSFFECRSNCVGLNLGNCRRFV